MARGRPAGITALSAWEMDEMRMLRRRGWTLFELAAFYGVCERTVSRYIRRGEALRRDSSAENSKTE